jgi:glycyl-tRNA synthetase beta subunit
LSFDLKSGLGAAAERLPIAASPESQAACLEFIVKRLRNTLLEQGWQYDVVDGVLASQGENPAHAALAVKELSAWITRSDWDTILPAYSRCVRITRDFSEEFALSSDYLVEPAEHELYQALLSAEARARKPGSVDDFLNAFLPIIPAINRFFDDVLVMAEDKHLQENRLGLLQRLAALADGVVDLSYLEGF